MLISTVYNIITVHYITKVPESTSLLTIVIRYDAINIDMQETAWILYYM